MTKWKIFGVSVSLIIIVLLTVILTRLFGSQVPVVNNIGS